MRSLSGLMDDGGLVVVENGMGHHRFLARWTGGGGRRGDRLTRKRIVLLSIACHFLGIGRHGAVVSAQYVAGQKVAFAGGDKIGSAENAPSALNDACGAAVGNWRCKAGGVEDGAVAGLLSTGVHWFGSSDWFKSLGPPSPPPVPQWLQGSAEKGQQLFQQALEHMPTLPEVPAVPWDRLPLRPPWWIKIILKFLQGMLRVLTFLTWLIYYLFHDPDAPKTVGTILCAVYGIMASIATTCMRKGYLQVRQKRVERAVAFAGMLDVLPDTRDGAGNSLTSYEEDFDGQGRCANCSGRKGQAAMATCNCILQCAWCSGKGCADLACGAVCGTCWFLGVRPLLSLTCKGTLWCCGKIFTAMRASAEAEYAAEVGEPTDDKGERRMRRISARGEQGHGVELALRGGPDGRPPQSRSRSESPLRAGQARSGRSTPGSRSPRRQRGLSLVSEEEEETELEAGAEIDSPQWGSTASTMASPERDVGVASSRSYGKNEKSGRGRRKVMGESAFEESNVAVGLLEAIDEWELTVGDGEDDGDLYERRQGREFSRGTDGGHDTDDIYSRGLGRDGGTCCLLGTMHRNLFGDGDYLQVPEDDTEGRMIMRTIRSKEGFVALEGDEEGDLVSDPLMIVESREKNSFREEEAGPTDDGDDDDDGLKRRGLAQAAVDVEEACGCCCDTFAVLWNSWWQIGVSLYFFANPAIEVLAHLVAPLSVVIVVRHGVQLCSNIFLAMLFLGEWPAAIDLIGTSLLTVSVYCTCRATHGSDPSRSATAAVLQDTNPTAPAGHLRGAANGAIGSISEKLSLNSAFKLPFAWPPQGIRDQVQRLTSGLDSPSGRLFFWFHIWFVGLCMAIIVIGLTRNYWLAAGGLSKIIARIGRCCQACWGRWESSSDVSDEWQGRGGSLLHRHADEDSEHPTALRRRSEDLSPGGGGGTRGVGRPTWFEKLSRRLHLRRDGAEQRAQPVGGNNGSTNLTVMWSTFVSRPLAGGDEPEVEESDQSRLEAELEARGEGVPHCCAALGVAGKILTAVWRWVSELHSAAVLVAAGSGLCSAGALIAGRATYVVLFDGMLSLSVFTNSGVGGLLKGCFFATFWCAFLQFAFLSAALQARGGKVVPVVAVRRAATLTSAAVGSVAIFGESPQNGSLFAVGIFAACVGAACMGGPRLKRLAGTSANLPETANRTEDTPSDGNNDRI